MGIIKESGVARYERVESKKDLRCPLAAGGCAIQR